jgi:DNA-directed RNA polymerase specialized sigma24 family protein
VQPSHQPQRAAVVYAPSFFADDAALLEALRQGKRGARAVVYRRHVDAVELILSRILGPDAQLDDRVSQVFRAAMRRVRRYEGGPQEMRTWLRSLAVEHGRKALARRRFLAALFAFRLVGFAPRLMNFTYQVFARGDSARGDSARGDSARGALATESADVAADAPGTPGQDAAGAPPAAATYALLRRLPAESATMLALHWIGQLPLEEVAALSGVAVPVARRRLLRARCRFLDLAWATPELRMWVCNVSRV